MKIIPCLFLLLGQLSQATPIPQGGAVATPCAFGPFGCDFKAVRVCDSALIKILYLSPFMLM